MSGVQSTVRGGEGRTPLAPEASIVDALRAGASLCDGAPQVGCVHEQPLPQHDVELVLLNQPFHTYRIRISN